LSKLFGTVVIAIGAAFVVVRPDRFGSVFLSLPSGIDIHTYDLIGMAVIAIGIVSVWR
jgi:hypothetical protein